jgi:hypothetical protein
MSPLAALFESGAVAGLLVAVLVAEAILLVLARRPAGAVLLALSPAVCFAVSLGAALTGQAWPLVAVPVALALPLHLADLRRRGWL